MKHTQCAQVDELHSPQRMIAFGLQHVLVMAASPIAAVFLMSKALGLDASLTTQLLSATFLVCGIGTLIQSFGPGGIGARLPFVMLPGGAPIVLFILIAQQSDLPTASGAVILAAALPLLLFTLISMVEATGQTIALNEVLGKESEAEQQREVPNTIRGDGLASLLGGIFGTSLIITSGENIGIIRATQVRSRYVTAVSGLFLILFGIFSPLSALISVIPGAVIGATGLVVFAIVGTMGIDMLRKVDLRNHSAMYVVATALAVGLLPIVVPGIYDQLPSQLRLLLANGVAMGAVTAAVLNYLFVHLGRGAAQPSAAPAPHP